MSTAFRTAVSHAFTVAVVILACQAPVAQAQTTQVAQVTQATPVPAHVAERLHADALASFRAARFPEAYGRLIRLANAGHAPSARLVLWMFANGATVFGNDWDSSPEQLEDWARTAGQPVPVTTAHSERARVAAR